MGAIRRSFAAITGLAAAPAAALAVGLAAALAAVTPAASAAQPASQQSASAASLTAVSCPAATWCMAVGSYTTRSGGQHALAQIWNGRTWQVRKPPGPSLTSVSCTATWFCLAAGGPTGVEQWNGTSWREIPGPQGATTAPACGSRSWCVVVNGSIKHPAESFAETWNGHRWRTWWEDTNVCSQNGPGLYGYPCALTAVACGGPANCVTVGYSSAYPGVEEPPTQVPAGYSWNGQHWALAALPNLPFLITEVSCAGTFCLGVDGASVNGTGAATWNAKTRTWTVLNSHFGCGPGPNNCGDVYALSCASATSCLVFSRFSGNQFWNGSTWRPAPSIGAGKGSLLGAVSCHAAGPGGTACLAVGHQTHNGVRRTLAELWNGTTWKILATPNIA